jgi:cell wall-associated NlpC family hydrolase
MHPIIPLKRVLIYALFLSALLIYPIQTLAQNGDTRPRRVFNYLADDFKPHKTLSSNSRTGVNAGLDDPKPRRTLNNRADLNYIAEDVKPRKPPGTNSRPSLARYNQLISTAINDRLGTPYQWAATGPDSFDCYGFVWDTFHSVGINFQRASAATLWAQFEPPGPDQEFKFGTLVFFSGQTHVGIVANEHGFYHASKHKGVVYDEFNDYWISRIDGFRLVPMATQNQQADKVVLRASLEKRH